MEKDLLIVLQDIQKKIEKMHVGKTKDTFNKQLQDLLKEYSTIQVSERHLEMYNSLISKGKELMKDSNIKDSKKVAYYLRYCGAALYDFKDDIKPLNLILKSYLLTCTLFFVLAPQYFSFILPLLFVIPIFMGLRGMRKRVLNGLMIGVSVVPMSLLVSIVWLRNAFLMMGSFDVFVNQLAQQYGFSYQFTQNFTIACIAMSVVMFGSSIVLLVSAIKYRKMFI